MWYCMGVNSFVHSVAVNTVFAKTPLNLTKVTLNCMFLFDYSLKINNSQTEPSKLHSSGHFVN